MRIVNRIFLINNMVFQFLNSEIYLKVKWGKKTTIYTCCLRAWSIFCCWLTFAIRECVKWSHPTWISFCWRFKCYVNALIRESLWFMKHSIRFLCLKKQISIAKMKTGFPFIHVWHWATVQIQIHYFSITC